MSNESGRWDTGYDEGFLALFEALPYPCFLLEEESGRILNVNGAALLLYGGTRRYFLRKRYRDLLAPSPEGESESKTGQGFSLQSHLTKDKNEIVVEVATTPALLHGRHVRLCIVRDISRQLKQEGELQEKVSRLQYLAYHDSLTGLPNRLLFKDRIEHALAVARRMSQQLALLFIDVDFFKNINDSFGHEAGDKVLCEVARRLRGGLREADTLARMGGDEFLVIVEQVRNEEQVAEVIRKIRDSLATEIEVDGQPVRISVSIGGSMFPAHATDSGGLMRAADRALLLAKEQGRNSYRI